MPKRTDIHSVLILGSGPIVIGQACEFDYSGTQACKALREEGFRVILVNSNPATIMTDPEMSDRTYIEPLTPEIVEKILVQERPDALLPTLGGQTGLNLAFALAESGVLERLGVQMIGASRDAIFKAEDRQAFKDAMARIGLEVPCSGVAHGMDEARRLRDEVHLPCVIRPAFTLGGSGGGIAYNVDEFEDICARGLALSMIGEVLIEESVIGWKEFELEVMRDVKDNFVVICSIENFDPMGVHTGDSITVAPAQTLTDKESQRMRDAAKRIIREIGVETGGSNIQFAIHPETGRMVIIEMNPRVSRSSALASKATGFAIARIATKLAIGYTLDEIPNDITQKTPACFEPAIDYVVTKIPRWGFEKFPKADRTLTTQMKSIGEVMAIGRTFKESLQKALRSLEIGRFGLGADPKDPALRGEVPERDVILKLLRVPTPDRIFAIRHAFLRGMSVAEVAEESLIDPWFLDNLHQIVETEAQLRRCGSLEAISAERLRRAKAEGFSDIQLGAIFGCDAARVRERRAREAIRPVYKLVDTCAAEFEAATPYYYSTYERTDEAKVSARPRIVILGGGPNRIGQGIEFDYCCVHAAFALRELGFETVMVNSNPETVSTDFDTSDRLFFEPLTEEDVRHVCERVQPHGVIVQFGGQTPLNLARALEDAGVPILGTSVDSIDIAEDRKRFSAIVRRLGIRQPPNGIAASLPQARRIAKRVGYPVLVRPSYVLGGRAMEIVYDDAGLERFFREAVEASPDRPVLIDQYLEDAVELDVDMVSDGKRGVVGAIMEHIEEAGVHSGDSTCVIPPFSLGDATLGRIREATHSFAKALKVVGLMNVQYAVKNDVVYVLEVNPRASRTVPFVSKAIGVPLAKLAAKVMAGKTLEELGFTEEVHPEHVAVKAPVFPFAKFHGVDILLSPEMRSTGEVMGIDHELGPALAKALLAASQNVPSKGNVFLSVRDSEKRSVVFLAKRLEELGFGIIATHGTYQMLRRAGLRVRRVNKLHEGRPHIVDLIKNREIDLLVNLPATGLQPRADEAVIRSQAVEYNIPSITTLAGFQAAVSGIEALVERQLEVAPLQDYFAAGRPAIGSAASIR